MISVQSFSIDWIREVSQRYRADSILVEKTILALALLEGLAKARLPFVFKGGTSLMLLFEKPHRLSIDINIILPPKWERLDSALKDVAENGEFIRYEESNRSKQNKIPKKHYKFYYNSAVEKKESFVLLDILFDEIPYDNLVEIPIHNQFLLVDGDCVTVKVPDFDNIIADKLTAFAPRTIGVPYRKNEKVCGMEIIKQLYDVGQLFAKTDNLSSITNTYNRIAQKEIEYRQAECTIEDALHDTWDNAMSICMRRDFRGAEFTILKDGIHQVQSYIFIEPFHIEHAVQYASKVAYLVALILNKRTTIERYEDIPILQLKNWNITNVEYSKLNKLKKSNPEAFFYIYMTVNAMAEREAESAQAEHEGDHVGRGGNMKPLK